ncbi:MAG: hypothetical protein H7A47_03490 [Verrucomicrobiales bacterium]|nr:hypothetical protein [Verrucomicrobiales bacterium]
MQKPKADKALTLVNFVTDQQRLVDQVAVPANTNEEAAVAAHWSSMDSPGVCHDRCRPHHQGQRAATHPGQRADYLLILKGNQPGAFAKAQPLLGALFPSGPHHRKGTGG